ncbi:hypothetical protein ACWGH2_28875 [Streptomyces sp. NPDC054871]
MAITMKNYGLTWTDPDGTPRASVCSYDKGSAEDRKLKLKAGGCTKVRVEETKPGQLLQPQA